MTHLFFEIVNMSLTSSILILLVMFLRLFMKRLPRLFSYQLWFIPAIRLVSYISINADISLFNISNSVGTVVVSDAIMQSDLSSMNHIYTSKIGSSFFDVLPYIWILGMVVLSTFYMIQYIRLWRQLRFAVRKEKNIYETELPSAPFCFGLLFQKIYIPKGYEEEKYYVILAHEKTHAKRFDSLVKTVGLCAVILHWFNPLVWYGYRLMCYDQEISCDEAVLRKISKDEYAKTVLSIASVDNVINPAAGFGTVKIKKRIKNIANYKNKGKHTFVIGIIILCLFFAMGCTNPIKKNMLVDEILSVSKYDFPYDEQTPKELSTEDLVYKCSEMLFIAKGFYYPNEGSAFYKSVRRQSPYYDELFKRKDIVRVLEEIKRTENDNYSSRVLAQELLEIYYRTNKES